MADIDWALHSNEEIMRAAESVPRIFSAWEEWPPLYGGPGYGWSRRELLPGPSWKSGGTISVQRNTGIPGYGVSWWDGSENLCANNFQTHEEAMTYGDAWLLSRGYRISGQASPQASKESDK